MTPDFELLLGITDKIQSPVTRGALKAATFSVADSLKPLQDAKKFRKASENYAEIA